MDQSKERSNGDATRLLTNPDNRTVSPSLATDGKADTPPGTDEGQVKGIGDTLNGRFVLEECLGFGGMGMVYKALDLRKLEASDRKPYIAIKVLNVQFRGHPKSFIALQREAKKAQALAHPNIVTVYDFDRDGPMVYLTMEYLAGKPLSQLLRTPDFKGLSYAEALPIISGMASALAYAHERGFVHCDLKPANVFLTDTGEVKVIDFGIARVFQKPEEDVEATVFDPGSLGGMTPTYASPEMLEHRDPDPRDDIYALGCISYELLSGHHPFDRLPATQARSAGLKPQRPKELGRKPWRALQAALSFERESRTPSVTLFLQGIRGERREMKHATMAMAALMMSLIIAGGIVHYRESGTDPAAEAALAESRPAILPPLAPGAALEELPVSVASVLDRVPCSALTASMRDGDILVKGYLPRQYGIPRLKEMLEAVPGLARLALDVHPVNDDDCAIIAAFAPYWRNNRETGGNTSIRTKEGDAEMEEGDSLILDITTPGHDAYVNIDYYILDGSVIHLVPSPRARNNQAPPNYAATVGSMGNWVVSKPFGNELIVFLATPVPLFDEIRPEHESRTGYLQAVEKQLALIAAKYGADRLTADFIQISTRPKP